MDRVTQLAEELDALHRGRGFNADDVTERVGPALSRIAFGDNDADAAYGRDLLRRWLLAGASDLPNDLRTIFLGASGLRDLRPLLTDRIAALAHTTGLSPRTIRRRLREADRLVAAALLNRSHTTADDNPFAVSGWYVDCLHATAYLNDDRPRFHSLREIIATHTGVEEICESWSIPRPANEPLLQDLELVATQGGEITELTKISPSTWRVVVRLERSLAPRDRQLLGLSVTLPSRAFVRPINGFVPVRRTRSFRSEVHYGPTTGLTRAWRIDGVPPMAVDDDVPLGDQFNLADGNPLIAEWKTVRRGLAYGIGWSW